MTQNAWRGPAINLLLAAALLVVFGVCNAQTPPEMGVPRQPAGL